MKYVLLPVYIFLSSFLLFSQAITIEEAGKNGRSDAAVYADDDAGEKPDTPEEQSETQAETEAETKTDNSSQNTVLNPAYVLERDIATSTQDELADWCRSLGLSVDGGREALSGRLREYYKLESITPETVETGQNNAQIITIENAKTTEYFTVESVHENYVRLGGGVSLSIKDGEILHKVKADQILYNRTRKLLTATGSVEYVKEEGDTIETFKGEGITVNLDNWSVVFMKGVSDHELTETEASYRFAGEVISRSGENSTVLRHAEITNAGEEESLWSIKAARLWLLPGSDWAVLSAVIKVGEVPVLWLPAFYYPANEIIFHPVLGVRTRAGTFVQTTTYILGRPRASSSSEESSITAIMGSGEGMEKTREGVFLRSTGVKHRNENEVQLSVMADAYVNLGYYLGSELTIPAKNNTGEMFFSGGVGFSREVTMDMGIYTPFFPDYDRTSNWHSSRFFDYTVPFRYRFIGTGSANASGAFVKRAEISWKLPFYSDPYVDNDFMNRSEDSNLFSQIKTATTPDSKESDTSLGSYLWELTGRLSFSTTPFEPFINDLSILNLSTVMAFDTRTTFPSPSNLPPVSYPPDQTFFYPNKFTLFSVTASIGGSPVTLGSQNTEKGEDAIIEGWPNPVSPWEKQKEEDIHGENAGEIHPPSISRTTHTMAPGGHLFSVDYRITPSAFSELRFNSDKPGVRWNSQEDIDWSDIEYQLYSFKADGNIGLSLSEKWNWYTHSLRFTGTSSWQDYSYMDDTVYAAGSAKLENAERQMHNMSYFSSSAEYGFTLRPFVQSEIWKTSYLSYTLGGLLVSGRYTNDDWSVKTGKWDRENITNHSIQMNLGANVLDKMQNLSISVDLPPKEAVVSANAAARIWVSETTANTKILRPFDDPYYNPISIIETLTFPKNISLIQTVIYDPEKSNWTKLSTGFTWDGLSISYLAERSFGYELVTRDDALTDPLGRSFGWYQDTKEKLNPRSLSIGYRKSITINEGGRVNFNGSVNTSLNFDLQRYTNSQFNFELDAGFSINRFLDITLRSNSVNNVIFRYFQDTPFFGNTGIDLPGEKNPLIDLFNSFRFDSMSKRQSSGFKLLSLGLDLVHHLGDWDATLGISFTPRPDTMTRTYNYYYEISFVVQWKPVKEFKTGTKYNSDDGLSFD